MFKISSKNIENCRRKTKKETIFVLSYQDRTRIGPFFNFLLHFLIFVLILFSIASQHSCEAKFKISSKNIEKCRRNSKKGPILVISWLVLSCLIFVTVAVTKIKQILNINNGKTSSPMFLLHFLSVIMVPLCGLRLNKWITYSNVPLTLYNLELRLQITNTILKELFHCFESP